MSAAANLTAPVAPCPCGNARPRLIAHPAAKDIISVRCNACGRQGLGGLSEGMALRNWRELLKDGATNG